MIGKSSFPSMSIYITPATLTSEGKESYIHQVDVARLFSMSAAKDQGPVGKNWNIGSSMQTQRRTSESDSTGKG